MSTIHYLLNILRRDEGEPLHPADVLAARYDGCSGWEGLEPLLGTRRSDRSQVRLRRRRQDDSLRRGSVLGDGTTNNLVGKKTIVLSVIRG